MAITPDIDDVKDAYIAKRVGELMTSGSKQGDVEAIAEEEFQDFIDSLRESILEEFRLDPRGNVITND